MSTRKLLLADDSITIQKVVNLTFADEGFEVITVGDGDAAMEKLIETAPDLVMADVKMPGLNGYQICERIKQDEKFRRIPVMLLVGSFEPFDEEEARRVGADDFLTKPFQSIRQLVSKVTVLLEANDKNADNFYDATANNSFADTIEMNETEISETADSGELGDAGMDDEMIQTNQINNFALDESAKFETKEFSETYEDKSTKPLSVYDLKEFSFVAAPNEETEISEMTAEEPAESQIAEERSLAETPPTKERFAPFSNFNDDDLLEIPFDEEDEPIPVEETAPEQTSESREERIEENGEFTDKTVSSQQVDAETEAYRGENEIVVGSLTEPAAEEKPFEMNETQRSAEFSTQFPPELIEAVAQRVIEKLSDRVVREIAWEVVPQHADLIIKKMVEEKLRDG